MTIAQIIQNSIETMPAGKIFGYQELPNYSLSPSAVIKAIGRMVSSEKLKRFSKGKFDVPKKVLWVLENHRIVNLFVQCCIKMGFCVVI